MTGKGILMTDGYAELKINGARFRSEVRGQGMPLFLMHSGVADSRMWDAQVEFFSKNYKVFRFDFRGYGFSSDRTSPFSHREDVVGLMNALGIDSGILVGCSLGGDVAMSVALEYPEKVKRLILVAPGLDGFEWGGQTNEYLARLEEAWMKGDQETVTQMTLKKWLSGERREISEISQDIVCKAKEMMYSVTRNNTQQQTPPSRRTIDHLEEISCPTLLVIGSLDAHELHTIGDILMKRIPNIEKTELQGVAHYPNMERPDDFNRIITDWLYKK